MSESIIRVGRFGNVLLFLILELFAFFLVIRYNNTQRKIFFHSSNLLSSSIYDRYDRFVDYFSLNQISDSLSKENARLRNSSIPYKYIYFGEADTLEIQDTTQQYLAIPARVRSLSVNRRNNNIIIDKGSDNGLSEDMAVIGLDGIVGVTRICSRKFCSVLPLIHSKSSVSVALKGSQYFGNLTWESSNPNILNIQGIPQHAEVEKGDTVVSSGYSMLFPGGIVVGTIEDAIINSGSNFYDLEVKLLNDFYNLQYVYVIKNLLKNDIDSVILEEEL